MMILVYRIMSIAMATKPDQETLQRELDEVIAMFAERHARAAELRRVLERTCHRLEAALALAREIKRLHLYL